MAGVAEKARFYLERSVPQLREWEEREIFKPDEIRTIVKRRSQFEHTVLAPGNTPHDWSSYAQWEHHLDKLRTKRCARLRVRRLASAHASQGRVLGIYERAVARHPGSGPLWREYLAYTADVARASKRWRRTVTRALRMLPTDPDLWAVAARRAASTGDMAAARAFFMRGCRFCAADDRLWLEYARCEMVWLEKTELKKIKASSSSSSSSKTTTVVPDDDDDELRLDSDDDDDDNLLLPEPTTTQANPVIDATSAQQLLAPTTTPALDGAIPLAIFDVARRQAFFGPDVAERFFLMLCAFRRVAARARVAAHVLDVLQAEWPRHPATASCLVRAPVAGVSPFTPEFPRGLREALPLLTACLATTSDRDALVARTNAWIDECLALDGLDAGIRTVLEYTKKSLVADA